MTIHDEAYLNALTKADETLACFIGPKHSVRAEIALLKQERLSEIAKRSECVGSQAEQRDRQAASSDPAMDCGSTADGNATAEPGAVVRYGLEANDRVSRAAAMRNTFIPYFGRKL